MTEPIQRLMEEHRVIEKVLTALEAAEARRLPLSFYERAVDFITNFADACHHGKEEDRLFPVLEERGIPRHAGPVGCMCDEHETGRKHVARMRELLASEDLTALRKESLKYASLLRQHIHKEDNVLFPMGIRVLTEADTARLDRSFREFDASQEHERYTALAQDLLTEAATGNGIS